MRRISAVAQMMSRRKISIRYAPGVDVMTTFFFTQIVTAIFFYSEIENHSLIVSSQPNEVEGKKERRKKSFTFSAKNLVSSIT